MLQSNTHSPISSIGEFSLIKHLTDSTVLHPTNDTIKGVGDDAAVLEKNDSTYTLVTTDMLLEGVHFDLSYCPLKHLGYKAAVVNFSDIYAMNGRPKYITINIGISNRFSIEALEELYAGIHLACKEHAVDLVGGDTSSARNGMVLSITCVGEVEKNKVSYRSGAKVNDLIIVTGDLGAAYLGLQILEREKAIFLENPNHQPDLEPFHYIIERQLKPEARKDTIQFLDENNIIPTSMIDISDGLSSELLHICKASNVGAKIYENKIPLDTQTQDVAHEWKLAAITAALSGGEDYELLFTVDQKYYEILKANPAISIIGHITEPTDGVYLVDNKEQFFEISARGWTAF